MCIRDRMNTRCVPTILTHLSSYSLSSLSVGHICNVSRLFMLDRVFTKESNKNLPYKTTIKNFNFP